MSLELLPRATPEDAKSTQVIRTHRYSDLSTRPRLSPPSSPGLSQLKTAEAATEPLSDDTKSTQIVCACQGL